MLVLFFTKPLIDSTNYSDCEEYNRLQEHEMKAYYNITEAAEIIGISYTTLAKQANNRRVIVQEECSSGKPRLTIPHREVMRLKEKYAQKMQLRRSA